MRIVRTIIFILVCIGLIWLCVALLARAFSGGNTTTVEEKPALTTYATTDTEARMLIAGPIIQDQEHQSLRITVSRAQTQIEVLTGYNGQVVRQGTYANTESSYKEFLAGLDQLGFSEGIVSPATGAQQGKCPLGNRTTYTLEDSSTLIGEGWTTSCGPGSIRLNRNQIRTLFIRQIPAKEYTEITKDLTIV